MQSFTSDKTISSAVAHDEARSTINVESPRFRRSERLLGLACLRCDFTSTELDYPDGCPKCKRLNHAANLYCLYRDSGSSNPLIDLPYDAVVDLGQGNTPLVEIPERLQGDRATQPAYFKLESANPTGSHKDRMAAYGVAHAAATGKHEVIAASSGNAGVSVAAFAAAVGLPCEIAVTPACNAAYRAQMTQYGAVVTECADSLSRWSYIADRCQDPHVYSITNYALPAVGSPAIAIEGYKSIALELVATLQSDIDEVFVPVARGDLLWGLYLGFKALFDQKYVSTLPRLIAVEPFPRLAKVLEGADYRSQFDGKTQQLSTSGSTVTLQALEAVLRSNGRVEVVGDEEALRIRDRLARAGFSFELCAAAACSAHARGRSASTDGQQAIVSVVIATAHGRNDAF